MHFAGEKVGLSLGKNQWMTIIGNRVADYLVISVNLEVSKHVSRWLRAFKKLYMHDCLLDNRGRVPAFRLT